MKDRSTSSSEAAGAGDDAAPRKPTLALHYDDDRIGIGKRLLFEAATPAAALEVAAGEAAGRQARLFVDGAPLCSLLKADDEHPYWVVAGSGTSPEEHISPGTAGDIP